MRWFWPALIVGVGALVGYEAWKGDLFGGAVSNPEKRRSAGSLAHDFGGRAVGKGSYRFENEGDAEDFAARARVEGIPAERFGGTMVGIRPTYRRPRPVKNPEDCGCGCGGSGACGA